nr:hypothetical protein [uncultured Methanoregula sp.]
MGEIDDILNDEITVEPYVSRDAAGKITYGPAVTYPAFVTMRIKMVKSQSGQDAVSNCSIMLDGAVVLDRFGRDRITIDPGTANARSPQILALEDAKDGDGNRIYWEVSS